MSYSCVKIEQEKRQFVEGLGNKLVESINWNATANATSVLSAALIGSPHTGMARSALVERVAQLVKVLDYQKARLTDALWADRQGFEESIAFMIRNDLVEMSDDFGTEIIFYQASRRNVLDLYREQHRPLSGVAQFSFAESSARLFRRRNR